MDMIEKNDGTIRIVTLAADMTVAANLAMRNEIDSALASPACRKLYLDFTGVRFMNSSGIGVLLFGHRQMRDEKKELIVCNLSPELRRMFADVRLDSVFSLDVKENAGT